MEYPRGPAHKGACLEPAVRRGTRQGVGSGQLKPLGPIRYRRNRKEVHAFPGVANDDSEPMLYILRGRLRGIHRKKERLRTAPPGSNSVSRSTHKSPAGYSR